jgi:hypothetical protein
VCGYFFLQSALGFKAFGRAAQTVRPVLTLIRKKGVIVAILLLRQHLTHQRRIVFLSDEPVSIPFQIFKGMDRLAKLGLRKSLSLLAVADIFEDPIALDKKKLLVAQLQIQAVAQTVVHQWSQPRHPIEIAFSEPGILPLARCFGGGKAGTRHRLTT